MAIQPAPHQEPVAPVVHLHGAAGPDDEARLVRHIIVAMCVAVPLFIGIWVGLISLAVTIAGVGYAAPILMGIAVGTLAGVFFGAWIGFVLFSREID